MVAAYRDTAFDHEMRVRRKIANIFNKRQEDFSSLKEYNDYLDEVEDMTFNLIERIGTEAIKAKIANYEEENAEQIINARARKAEELAAALKASKGGNAAQKDITDGVQGQSSQPAVGGVTGQYAPTAVGGALVRPRPTGTVLQLQPVLVGSGPEAQGYFMDDEEMQKLRAERGGRAGGWTIELSKRRAFEEAFGSMWI